MEVTTILLLSVFAAVHCDIYMHWMRGSNNRLNGAGGNVQNNNRLYDSQNNNKGGYCWGPQMNFYEETMVPIEWTSQHSCGYGNAECQVVLQYMCVSTNDPEYNRIRDGKTTETIPDTEKYNDKDENGDFKYGMHESHAYYKQCKNRERNKGLFIADRTLNRNDARATRQNNNGARRGFECPEERDYYPYFHPTPWKDIAILTTDTENCDFYQEHSENVKGRGWCNIDNTADGKQPNYKTHCESEGGEWKVEPSHEIDEPYCGEAPWNRDNHLGNGVGGQTNRYNWTLPTADEEPCIKDGSCACVLRVRYNISTGDTDNWGHSSDDLSFMDLTFNGRSSPIKNDPHIPAGGGVNMTLAIDTSQFGRTFQDRSHTFGIKERPGFIGGGTIWNVGVRGKRGNIVQTFPATEYDFVPNHMHASIGDYIHWQWTGCDTNPAGNDGEGKAQTDRSNVVHVSSNTKNVPCHDGSYEEEDNECDEPLFEEQGLRRHFTFLGQENCKTYAELNNDQQDDRNCFKLNAASPYFDGGLVRINKTGTFHYMSTRNNNFSNRSQKGLIIVETMSGWWIAALVIGSVMILGIGAVAALVVYAKAHPHSAIALKLPI